MLDKPLIAPGRDQGRLFVLVLGVVIGLLAAGLGVPFLFGTPLNSAGPAAVRPLGGLSGLPASGAGSSGASGGPASALSGGSTASGSAALSGRGGLGTAIGGSLAGSTTPPGGPAGGAGAVSGLTASDRGVTPTTITVAFLIVDLGSVSKLGFGVPGFDPKEQEAYDSTFVNNINAHGGIFGRKIVPLFFTYDPTNASTDEAACIQATQDHAVFAAIDSGGSLDFQSQLCFTQQNHTPLIDIGSFGTPQDLYQQAGSLFTTFPEGVRSLANMVDQLASQGLLKGKHIGILDRDFPGTTKTVTDGFVAVLKQYGYQVTYRADISMDNGTASSQVPVAVQQMQAHGVDAVMYFADLIIGTEFVQSADKSAYHPEYFGSDFEAMTNDTSVQAMPASFQAVAVTTTRVGEWRVGIAEPAVDASCRETYAKATGNDPKRSDLAYGGVLVACGLVDLLARGTQGAGADLTRAKYVASLQQIGSVAFPYFGGFSFRPGKFGGGDPVRTVVYHQSCTCWMPIGSFAGPKY